MIKRLKNRVVGASVLLTVFAAMTVFPFAHEWEEARQEAAFHRGDSNDRAPSLKTETPSRRRHHHHDPSACRLCLSFSRERHVLALAGPAPRLYVWVADVVDSQVLFGLRLDRGSATPRGPPSA